ncbi:hypothetical protein [Bradyrhizobium pachyrhizi]|uniref:hypothetical protein n=1 Tax=Bradyrhizobium pachyrhizi TaxID=280333 RepID=UPI003D369E4F
MGRVDPVRDIVEAALAQNLVNLLGMPRVYWQFVFSVFKAACHNFGSYFASAVLQRSATIGMPEEEMGMPATTVGVLSSFPMSDDYVRPSAFRIEFVPEGLGGAEKLDVRVVDRGVDGEVVKRRSRAASVAQNLHIPHHTGKVARDRISDVQNLDGLVFSLQEVRDQVFAVSRRTAMFAVCDDHSGP